VVPSFGGFYVLFDYNAQRQIVTTLLDIEVALVLINGGLLWLFFAKREKEPLSTWEMRALAKALRNRQRGK